MYQYERALTDFDYSVNTRLKFCPRYKQNMSTFRKSGDCPTSQELLEFQNGDISVLEGKWIRIHLIDCEFCSAEVEFYEHFPQTEDVPEEIELPAMPTPLHDLAEALICKRESTDNIDRLFLSMSFHTYDED